MEGEAMKWEEIKRRLKNGTSVQILADLNGVTYKTMYNRIKWHEKNDGITYMTPESLNVKKKPGKKPEAKKAEKLPEVVKEPDNIPEDVYTKKEEPRPLVPVSDPEHEGLCPEVMETLRENYEICRKMAESYLKQANDYLHLLKRYGVDIPKAQEEFRRKLPEGMSL